MSASRKENPWEGDQYKVSPYNFLPEIQEQYDFRQPLVIQDWTPLKLDHLPASRLYSVEEYQEVARLLDAVGVQETVFLASQYGTAKDEQVWEGLRAVASLGLKTKIRVWGLFGTWQEGEYEEQIDRIADGGAQALGLSAVPARSQLGRTAEAPESDERLRDLPKAIDYANKRGLGVCVSSVYIGGDGDFLEDMQTVIDRQNFYLDNGAESLLMADSRGASTPDATRYLVKTLRAGLVRDVPVYFHARNNVGSATALVLAAASAGAWPQVSVNAIGDQSFASLEEVIVSLQLLYGVETGADLTKLPELSATVERITGVRRLPFQPITGEHMSLIDYPPHYLGYLRGKSYRELELSPYDLELAGMRPTTAMTYGLLSPQTVRAKLEEMGLPTDDGRVQEVYGAMKARLDALGNKFPVMLNEDEIEDICRGAQCP